MIRILDIIFSGLGLVVGFIPLLFLMLIGIFDNGSPMFFQKRIGRNQKIFTLLKLRSMRPGSVSVPTHLVDASQITPFGKLLRKSKLDELPQLWNVLIGDMSLVGPRPCLPIQSELIEERAQLGVYDVRPGITGLAQILNIDMSTPRRLAEVDAEMIASLNFIKYITYIVKTVLGNGQGDKVKKT